MTVGKTSVLCWTVFVVMSFAFTPVAQAINGVGALPARPLPAIVVVALLWWGPFAYAMYLAVAVIGNGDRRLLTRGIRGTAEVLTARRTRLVVQQGGFAWAGSRAYRYRLRVSLPDRAPYETVSWMCVRIGEGAIVDVMVAPHNRHRIRVETGHAPIERRTPEMQAAIDVFSTFPETENEPQDTPPEPLSPGTERIHRLVELARLHREGELGDAEYAAEKARIIGRS
ncbi:MAG: hypothetical protein ACRDP6_05775 [Actinoallomurus sp.]